MMTEETFPTFNLGESVTIAEYKIEPGELFPEEIEEESKIILPGDPVPSEKTYLLTLVNGEVKNSVEVEG